eukprot:scaffold1201_cov413-Prasinococcus_capsulatus_cf.AAC.5
MIGHGISGEIGGSEPMRVFVQYGGPRAQARSGVIQTVARGLSAQIAHRAIGAVAYRAPRGRFRV